MSNKRKRLSTDDADAPNRSAAADDATVGNGTVDDATPLVPTTNDNDDDDDDDGGAIANGDADGKGDDNDNDTNGGGEDDSNAPNIDMTKCECARPPSLLRSAKARTQIGTSSVCRITRRRGCDDGRCSPVVDGEPPAN